MRKLGWAIVCGAMCVALPLRAQMHRPDGVGSIDPSGEHDPSENQVRLPPDPEGKAEDLRLAGKCNEAVPILRRLAGGEPIAQYNLGQCLIDLGKGETDAQRARTFEQEGASWILRAANEGLPKAQSSLVAVYLNGSGVDKDPVEAAKWALLYQENGTRMVLGLPGISKDLQARLDDTLTAQAWNDAQQRASSWVPASQRSNADN